MADHVRQSLDEAAYQLCDGYAINTGYFSIHPNVGGTFNSSNEAFNSKKNPVTFRFRTRSPLHRLVEHIAIDIEGIADGSGYIDEFIDIDKNLSNSVFLPGDQFSILGHKIKIAGDETCGVYFVPVDDLSQAVKTTGIAENTPSRIIGIAPKTDFQQNKLEIRTQYSGSGNTFLKTARVITSSFTIEVT